MKLRFRRATVFLMSRAIPFEILNRTDSTTHMSAAFAGSPVDERGSVFGDKNMDFAPVNGTNQSTLAYHGCAAAC